MSKNYSPEHLTDSIVKNLVAPAKGNRIKYDDTVKGFGVRVTAAGARAFILNYRTRAHRDRRYTIGSYPDWKTAAARDHAGSLKQRISQGYDPVDAIQTERGAPTVADMCARFIDEHLPKTRPSTAGDYKAMIENEILPAMRSLKVAEVTYSDVDGLHRKITKRDAPYRANRTVAVLSKMFGLAIKWRMRADNPARGIERNPEVKRTRYLSGDELQRLSIALRQHENQQAANIIRLLLLTGSRRGEAQSARWQDFDLAAGVWTKPGAATKQKTEHRVPLSAPARQLLAELHKHAKKDAEYVFPGRVSFKSDVALDWAEICKVAKIKGARLHDLRHTFASILASSGLGLPIIGGLLGHTQAATTQRYAHLYDDPLRAAAERVGAVVSGQPSAEVHKLEKARK
jgi:integrase